jgi:hypothetical protein
MLMQFLRSLWRSRVRPREEQVPRIKHERTVDTRQKDGLNPFVFGMRQIGVTGVGRPSAQPGCRPLT